MANPAFSRRGGKFKAQPKVLIICEDSKSGKSYLQVAALHFRAGPTVSITHCGATDPGNIIGHALKHKADYEEVYCVIDRDRHETFDAALKQLKTAPGSSHIQPCVSCPCFEFWLVLHFGYCRPAYQAQGNKSPGDMVVADLRKKAGMEEYAKGSMTGLFAKLLGTPLDNARKHAARVLIDAEQTGEMNPSTTLHLVIGRLEALGHLQAV